MLAANVAASRFKRLQGEAEEKKAGMESKAMSESAAGFKSQHFVVKHIKALEKEIKYFSNSGNIKRFEAATIINNQK